MKTTNYWKRLEYRGHGLTGDNSQLTPGTDLVFPVRQLEQIDGAYQTLPRFQHNFTDNSLFKKSIIKDLIESRRIGQI